MEKLEPRQKVRIKEEFKDFYIKEVHGVLTVVKQTQQYPYPWEERFLGSILEPYSFLVQNTSGGFWENIYVVVRSDCFKFSINQDYLGPAYQFIDEEL